MQTQSPRNLVANAKWRTNMHVALTCTHKPKTILKSLTATILACSLGIAYGEVYAPDNFAAAGGTNLETMVMVKDANQRVLVGGLFTTVEGQAGYQGVARFKTDDSLDTGFKVMTDDFVKAIAVQQDGKILIGGQFHWVRPTGSGTNTTFWGVARLNADGTLDSTFKNAPAGKVKSNHNVRGIAVQADGKIIIGGYFTLIDGVARNYLARLNTDGSLDTSFTPIVNGYVEDVKLDAGGNILISGWFTQVQGASRWGVARLKADGALDPTFNANATPNGANSGSWPVYQLALQSNGQILYAGGTLRYGAEVHRGVARLNSDGTADSSFLSAINDWGTSVAVQTVSGEEKILVGGSFTVAGQRAIANDAVVGTDSPRRGVVRFNANGTVDDTFDTSAGTDTKVWAVLPNNDGKVYIGGTFNVVTGTVRHGIARLAPLDPTTQVIPFLTPEPSVYSAQTALAGAVVDWKPVPPTKSSANLPVTYTTSTPTICAVDANTGVVTLATPKPTADGECTITANAEAGEQVISGTTYQVKKAAPVTQSLRIVLLKAQTISFPSQAGQDVSAGAFPIAAPATADSGLPVTYSSLTPSICTVTATGVVTPLVSGNCQIAANQPGNSEFSPALQMATNIALSGAGGELPQQPSGATPVPTLGAAGLGLLGVLSAGLGALALRRRQRS